MPKTFVVYGAVGSGSVPIEATLHLLDQPYRVVESAPWEGQQEADKLGSINPMRQVPALVLPNGEVMAESAAILIWLADAFPDRRLAPAPNDPARPAFLHWMNFISSAIYALYWISDDPGRLVERTEDHASAKRRLHERIAHCWAIMGAQIKANHYLSGENLSVLDLYVATASRWSPGRRRFYDAAPDLMASIQRVDSDPRLTGIWAETFPFTPGWEY